jgi:hypothetical protein
LIIFDPPYFDKKAADYDKKSISGLSKKAYLEFDPPPKTGEQVKPIFSKYSSDLIELHSEKALAISEYVPK